MKKLLIILVSLFFAVSAWADSALQVDFLLAGYRSPTKDKVLAGGKIYTFLDGTSTLSALWTDKDKGGTATNPVILDSSGKAEIFGDNIYKFVIYDSSDVLIETLNGLQYKTSVTSTESLNADYGCDLPTALAAIGSVDVTQLDIDCDCVIADGTSATFTDNIIPNYVGGTIDGVVGGGIENLIFSGTDPLAGAYAIFGDNLTVTGLKATNPIWHGGVGDDSADDSSAVDKAFAASAKIKIPEGFIFLSDGSTITQAGTFIHGTGEIHASGDINNLLLITAADVTIDGPTFRGTGNTEQSAAIAEDDRICLIKSQGDRTVIKNTNQYVGYQIFTFLDGTVDNLVENNYFIGGVASMTSTAYQGVRGSGVMRSKVIDNFFLADDSGNITVEAINFVNTGGEQGYNTISRNHIERSYDHAIYVISGIADVIEGNVTISDGAGIVYTSRSNFSGAVDAEYPGAIIADNSITAGSGVGAATVGLHLRDTNHIKAIGNTISGYPTSIQMSPNQFNTTDNRIDNNLISENTCLNFTVTGINLGQAAKLLGSYSNNTVSLNQIFGDGLASEGIVWSLGASDSFNNTIESNKLYNLGYDAIVVSTVDDIAVNRNKIYGAGQDGIRITTATSIECKDNKIIDAGQDVGTFDGIGLSNADNGEVIGNHIENLTTQYMDYGIDGNNTSSGLVVKDNTILNMSVNPFRQIQQFTNTVVSNKTGTNSLTGTATLGAAASTVVANNNVQTGVGIESTITITPINAAAATLMAGAERPYVESRINSTSFQITTAAGGAAGGTEVFYYEIR